MGSPFVLIFNPLYKYFSLKHRGGSTDKRHESSSVGQATIVVISYFAALTIPEFEAPIYDIQFTPCNILNTEYLSKNFAEYASRDLLNTFVTQNAKVAEEVFSSLHLAIDN